MCQHVYLLGRTHSSVCILLFELLSSIDGFLADGKDKACMAFRYHDTGIKLRVCFFFVFFLDLVSTPRPILDTERAEALIIVERKNE